MRVLFVTTCLPPERMGGAETYAIQLAHGLAKAGITVDLVARNPGSSQDECQPRPHGQWYRLGSRVHPYFGYLVRLHKWLHNRGDDYDAIQFFDLNHATAVGLHATRRLQTPRIARNEGVVAWSAGQLRLTRVPFLGLWADRKLKTADHYVVVSQSEIEKMVSWGVPRDHVTFIPNGVPTSQFPRAPFSPRPVVICPARLRPEKNHAGLLRAYAAVQQAMPEAELWLAGDGPLEANLKAVARRLNIANSVRFLGHVTDMNALYAQCRVAVLLSHAEGPSLGILEAASVGRPAVVSAVGGLLDSVSDGITGRVVKPHDESGAAECLLRLLRDDEACAKAGEAAADFVRAQRSLDAIVPVYAEYLDACAQGRRSAQGLGGRSSL